MGHLFQCDGRHWKISGGQGVTWSNLRSWRSNWQLWEHVRGTRVEGEEVLGDQSLTLCARHQWLGPMEIERRRLWLWFNGRANGTNGWIGYSRDGKEKSRMSTRCMFWSISSRWHQFLRYKTKNNNNNKTKTTPPPHQTCIFGKWKRENYQEWLLLLKHLFVCVLMQFHLEGDIRMKVEGQMHLRI